MSSKVQVKLRWIMRRDMPDVLQIDHQGGDIPWCEEEFLRVLRQRSNLGMVVEYDDRVVGFMIYELHKSRLHVLKMAVHGDYSRMGIGTQMAEKLIGMLSSHRRPRIVLHVHKTNLPAQKFFESQGLKAIEVVREYYTDTREDALMMEYLYNLAP